MKMAYDFNGNGGDGLFPLHTKMPHKSGRIKEARSMALYTETYNQPRLINCL